MSKIRFAHYPSHIFLIEHFAGISYAVSMMFLSTYYAQNYTYITFATKATAVPL